MGRIKKIVDESIFIFEYNDKYLKLVGTQTKPTKMFTIKNLETGEFYKVDSAKCPEKLLEKLL